uniref:DUF4230 domain-containing protein n=1 Tax=Collinsella sp. BA40 TaxID=2560852 RepID=UPI0021063AF5|nr:DUF4230 domain-containing protein [Collinsella sp. BA40]
MKEKMKKLMGGKTFALRKSVVFALVAGLLLGAGGVLFFQWYNPKDEPQVETIDTSMIMSRVIDRSDMVTASQDYTIVEKAGDKNKLFDLIEIPFTQNSFWYLYAGSIEASVDLGKATWEPESSGVLKVTLPEPVLQNIPNMDVSGVFEEHNNVLNPIHVEDVDAFQRDCIAKSNQQAEEGGLKEQAKANAQANLQTMFDVACGEGRCTVEITWVPAEGGEQGE